MLPGVLFTGSFTDCSIGSLSRITGGVTILFGHEFVACPTPLLGRT